MRLPKPLPRRDDRPVIYNSMHFGRACIEVRPKFELWEGNGHILWGKDS